MENGKWKMESLLFLCEKSAFGYNFYKYCTRALAYIKYFLYLCALFMC